MPTSIKSPGSGKGRQKAARQIKDSSAIEDAVEETQVEIFKEEEKKEVDKALVIDNNSDKEMNFDNSDGDLSFQDNDSEKKSKKSKKSKVDLKKAFRNVKNKLSSRKRGKNDVKEISIKPESSAPQECWGSEPVRVKRPPGRPSENSSRSSSANSKSSKVADVDEDDDGIEVIYDAAYQAGEL